MSLFEETRFDTFTYRVLKEVHPSAGMTGESLAATNHIVKYLIKELVTKWNRLMLTTDLKTIKDREIQAAVPFVLKGELAKHAIAQGVKAVAKYEATPVEPAVKGAKKHPVSRGSRAGLLFPVTRIGKIMSETSTHSRKSDTAAVFLTAVVEYVVAEILELAGNMARDNNRTRIIPRYLSLPIQADPELRESFKNLIMSGGVARRHVEEADVKVAPAGGKAKKTKPVSKAVTKAKAVGKSSKAKTPKTKGGKKAKKSKVPKSKDRKKLPKAKGVKVFVKPKAKKAAKAA